MTKKDLLKSFCEVLRGEVEVMKSALADSLENATGDETRSEGKYDTRATEAAYLAEAQQEQIRLKEAALAELEGMKGMAWVEFGAGDVVGPNALVEVTMLSPEDEGAVEFYFLGPVAGGLMTTYLDCPATLITPESHLYQSLLGMKMGEELERPALVIEGVE